MPCSMIEEIDGYIWKKDASGVVVKDEPLKKDDHAMDAIRYAVMAVDKGVAKIEASSYRRGPRASRDGRAGAAASRRQCRSLVGWRRRMAVIHKVTCDGCERDLTTTGNAIGYRLVLSAEGIPVRSRMVTDTDDLCPARPRSITSAECNALANGLRKTARRREQREAERRARSRG